MFARVVAVAAMLFASAIAVFAQVDPSLYGEMHWRMIGPFRGGRTVAAVGVPSQPNVFYIGATNGGLWKSTDYGRVWTPIFDDQPTGSIGAIAIAPSDPNVIYVGSGEGLQRPDLSTGDGIYKSTDAGRTWQHLGLRDGQQIPMIVVDPHDPNRLFVAVLGHPYGPNPERGIFRSIDGGRTFEKVLYRDENSGAIDIAFDPSDSRTLYAALWAARQGPWENGVFRGSTSGLFKSTDGGSTWKQLTKGLPAASDGLSRIGIDVAAADPKRLYAVVSATKKGGGIYRSDDAGESWRSVNDDERLWGRDGDFAEVRSDPKNADVIYVANIATWKSTNGGKSFSGFRGAPGGDDYHRIWINPNDTRTILIAADQGAIVTVNGGESWSSWYNQPTAQFYHVNTDNAFPYRVCGGQQESGTACVSSRGDDGQITMREWHPVGGEEYGYAVPDPLDPDVVYGGKVTRYDRRTGQSQDVGPRPLGGAGYRTIRTMPLVFSAADPHALYHGANTIWRTRDGGQHWTELSPDLTRPTWNIPANVGAFSAQVKQTQRGVIYAIAPSPIEAQRIWAGTDDGLIHVTTDDGAHWTNVTPPSLVPWAKVSVMEASHFDVNCAYAAINTFRLDDLRPHILRTRDGGKSWSEIVAGIPGGAIINVVREDPKRRGLLFAGSETAVYVSFDDGDHWQSLRLNMPAISIRDLALHEDDLVAGTHGRGFWILDDIAPLRELAADAARTSPRLFTPARAWRVRWNKNTDTPLPPDEPAGQNPPDGAILDYYLPPNSSGAVTLELLTKEGEVLRRFTSDDPIRVPADQGNVPAYWIRPQRVLPATPGMHRVTWDLHLTPLPVARPSYPIAAVPHDTAPNATSPWVLPGDYIVRLTAAGQTTTRPLTIAIDPRVQTTPEGLSRQFVLSRQLYESMRSINENVAELRQLRSSFAASSAKDPARQELDRAVGKLLGDPSADDDDEAPSATAPETLTVTGASLRALLAQLQEADVAPTSQLETAVADRLAAARRLLERAAVSKGQWKKQ
jgi:photosystem II stability/assembly factor-like uncharacterized protein